MRAWIPRLLVAAALAAGGLAVGWAGDRARWSALVLHAEPLLVVGVLFGAYLAWAEAGRGLGRAVLVGGALGLAAMRLPFGGTTAMPPPPAWSGPVSRCAAALRPPTDDFRLLQWTLSGDEDPETVRALVARLAPGVTVLHGAPDEGLAAALAAEFGGEHAWLPRPEGGVALVTTGVFHLCGDANLWGDGQDDPDAATLAFVGVTPETAFPLAIARFPGPREARWAERMEAATASVHAVLGALQAPSTIVVADASAPWTYRHLDGGMAGAGLRAVRVPPDWPAHVGGLRFLPLHPYDRVWVGPAWTAASSRRVVVDQGARAPILTDFVPAMRAPETDGGEGEDGADEGG